MINKMSPISPLFYARDTVTVARDLVGMLLVRSIDNQILVGKIVETEAYYSHDPACHAFKGKTKANEALFGLPGCAYIYFIYGAHFCFNAVAHADDVPAGGVLIRAVEPLIGAEHMKKFRKNVSEKNLTNGPGKLAQALQITKKLYATNLTRQGDLYIAQGEHISDAHICATTRIGISKAVEKPWRFYEKNNRYVSKF